VSFLSAYRLYDSLLQHSQESSWNGSWHIADFIEEKGAFIGSSEHTFAISIGTGKRTFNVSEQFAFNE